MRGNNNIDPGGVSRSEPLNGQNALYPNNAKSGTLQQPKTSYCRPLNYYKILFPLKRVMKG